MDRCDWRTVGVVFKKILVDGARPRPFSRYFSLGPSSSHCWDNFVLTLCSNIVSRSFWPVSLPFCRSASCNQFMSLKTRVNNFSSISGQNRDHDFITDFVRKQNYLYIVSHVKGCLLFCSTNCHTAPGLWQRKKSLYQSQWKKSKAPILHLNWI